MDCSMPAFLVLHHLRSLLQLMSIEPSCHRAISFLFHPRERWLGLGKVPGPTGWVWTCPHRSLTTWLSQVEAGYFDVCPDIKGSTGLSSRFCSVEGKHIFLECCLRTLGEEEKSERLEKWRQKDWRWKSQGVDSELCSNTTKGRRGYEDEFYKKGTWTSLKEEC